MLGRRRSRWPDIKSTLVQSLFFVGFERYTCTEFINLQIQIEPGSISECSPVHKNWATKAPRTPQTTIYLSNAGVMGQQASSGYWVQAQVTM